MRAFLLLVALLPTLTAAAQPFPYGRVSAAASPADIQAALVGQAISASSYTATTTTGPAFNSTGNLVDAVRLGTGPRATIGTCQGGTAVCIGPDDQGFTTVLYVWGTIGTQMVQIRDSIDILGNAAILNNNGPVRITDTDGLTINGTTPLKGRVAASVTFDSAAISNNSCNPQTVTVAGAATGDFVSVNANFALPTGVSIGNARVTAANTVELTLCNVTTGGTLDPASGTYNFTLER